MEQNKPIPACQYRLIGILPASRMLLHFHIILHRVLLEKRLRCPLSVQTRQNGRDSYGNEDRCNARPKGYLAPASTTRKGKGGGLTWVSHRGPAYPTWQMHWNSPTRSRHVPPLRQGLDSHSLYSKLQSAPPNPEWCISTMQRGKN